jgi:hypothetical protein
MFIVNPYIYSAAFTNTNSLLFDGVDEYVDVNAPLTGMPEITGVQNFTTSAWVKFNTSPSQAYGIWQQYESTSKWLSVDYAVGDKFRFIFKGSIVGTTSNTFTTNTWYHVCAVYDGTQTGNANRCKIYINGVNESLTFAGTIPATSETGFTSASWEIGKGSTTGRYIDGYIDEVSIFDYSLTSGQVTSIYNTGTPTDLNNTSGVTAPVHWWRADDDTFPTINDVGTTGGNNGTMTNQESGDIVSDVPS